MKQVYFINVFNISSKRRELCRGGNSKEKVTILLGSNNMTGTDKIKPLLIGNLLIPF